MDLGAFLFLFFYGLKLFFMLGGKPMDTSKAQPSRNSAQAYHSLITLTKKSAPKKVQLQKGNVFLFLFFLGSRW